MQVSTEKVQEAIDALHAAEKALFDLDVPNEQYGVIAVRCAIAAVYLEMSLKIAGESHRVVHLTGVQS